VKVCGVQVLKFRAFLTLKVNGCVSCTLVLAVGKKPLTFLTSRPGKFQTQFGCDNEKLKHHTLRAFTHTLEPCPTPALDAI
jgi:hypothetical protein